MTVEQFSGVEPGWEWGLDWQLWACRASQVLGLLAVLGLLLEIGWTH